MSIRITFSILFYVNAGHSKGVNVPLYAPIAASGKKVYFSIKRKVLFKKWHQNANRVKGSSGKSKEVNHHLDITKKRIYDAYQELFLSSQVITAELSKNKYPGIVRRSTDFGWPCDHHHKAMKEPLEWGILKNYFTTRK